MFQGTKINVKLKMPYGISLLQIISAFIRGREGASWREGGGRGRGEEGGREGGGARGMGGGGGGGGRHTHTHSSKT